MNSQLKYMTIALTALGLLWTPIAGADDADEAKDIEKQEQKLDQEAADSAEGSQKVETKIKDQYGVDDARIAGLREKDYGYGEIKTTLALASRMEGGINDENVQKIVDLRGSGDNKTGWGEIAKQFDVKVGDLKKGLKGSAKKIKDNPSVSKNHPKHAPNRAPKGPRGPKGK